jgi:superoxide dismutase, Cu-Zn family
MSPAFRYRVEADRRLAGALRHLICVDTPVFFSSVGERYEEFRDTQRRASQLAADGRRGRVNDAGQKERAMKTMIGLAMVIVTGILCTGIADAQTARAELKDADGKTVGDAVLEQRANDVRITANFTGVPPGTHAFHIHEVGKCDPPFESAGGHFNPTGKQHGKDNPQGSHAGDLPNIQVPADGRLKVEATAKDVSLGAAKNGLLDADGSALVVHEGADDYKSDPAGNAGKRIACGVIHR